MEENPNIYQDWCYANHIYFYGFTKDCPQGYCKIIKWVNGIPTEGKKIFEIENIENTIMQLFKQIYHINH